MEESGTTTIEVTDDEARAFLRFREYQTLFIALLQARVFALCRARHIQYNFHLFLILAF